MRPCLTDYKNVSFLVPLPELGRLAAAETLTSMCVGKKELGAHGEDPVGRTGFTGQDQREGMKSVVRIQASCATFEILLYLSEPQFI